LAVLLPLITLAYQYFNKQPPQREQMPRESPRQQPSGETPTPRSRAPRRTPPAPQAGGHAPTMQAGEDGVKTFIDVVERVKDGDTIVLKKQGDARLIGVDCPEKKQDGGPEAKAFTEKALTGKTVEVELCAKQPTDRYGRSLAFIYLSDSQGRKVMFNSELVRQGYARVYSLRPCHVDEAAWGALYEQARAARRGLFGTLGDVPDAVSYRRGSRGETSGETSAPN